MLAVNLAKNGHKIAIHFNSSEEAAWNTLQKIGGRKAGHILVKADLSDLEQTLQVIPALQKWGKPAVLINNASTYFRRGMSEFSNAELIDDYTINFFSPLVLMREFKKHCGFGVVINFLDKRVDFVAPDAGPYALAKKSLRDATLSCAQEWAPKIRVNAIAPGPVLLPDEMVKSAEKKEALKALLEAVEHFINSPESGSVKIID